MPHSPMSRRLLSAAVLIAIPLICGAVLASGLANLWLDVPFVQQQKDGCGAASIAMVMQYWDQHRGQSLARPEAEPAPILRALYSGQAHGIYASAMVDYFQQNGYRAFAFAGRQADLVSQLQQGRPLIAALKPSFGPLLHYVVVVGLDEPRQLVLVNDPAQRKLLKEDQSRFEREWTATGHWILLAVPRDEHTRDELAPDERTPNGLTLMRALHVAAALLAGCLSGPLRTSRFNPMPTGNSRSSPLGNIGATS